VAAESAVETEAKSSLAGGRIADRATQLVTDPGLNTNATAGANTEAERLLHENRRVQMTAGQSWAEVSLQGARAELAANPGAGRNEAGQAVNRELGIAEGHVKRILDLLGDPSNTGQLTLADAGQQAIAAQAVALKSARARVAATLGEAQDRIGDALALRREEIYHLGQKPGGQNPGAVDSMVTKRLGAIRKTSLWLETSPTAADPEKINRHAVLLNDLYRATLGARHVSEVRLFTVDDRRKRWPATVSGSCLG
jgi:hypothetical protein